MTDPTHPTDDAPDRGELLAAYLEGELDDVRTRRLERDLEADADLRAQLDRIHDTVAMLRRVDAVEPPVELTDRIRARVRETDEAAVVPSEAPSGADRGRSAAGQAAGRRSARQWWQQPIAVAAAMALLGVLAVSSIGIGALSMGGEESAEDAEAGDSGDMSAMSAESAESAESGESGESGAEGGAEASGDEAATAMQQEEADDAAGAGPGDDTAAAQEEAATEAAAGALAPGLADQGIVTVPGLSSSADRADYLAEVRSRPEVRAVPETAPEAATTVDLARELLAADGLSPACVDTVLPDAASASDTAGASTDAVPYRVVEIVRTELDGDEALGAVTLDEDDVVTLRLVDPATCDVVAEDTAPP